MKRIITLSLGLLLTFWAAEAQQFEKGTTALNVGLGLGGILDDYYFYGNSSPMFNASIEHGLWDMAGPGVISLGGFLGFQTHRDDDYYSYYSSERWRHTVIGVRGNYHYNGFTNIPQLDLYAGSMIAYNAVSYTYTDSQGRKTKGSSKYRSGGVRFTAYAGGRWFFNEKFAGFVELGYGITALNFGGTIKF